MKILMMCYEFPPLGGGAASVVYGLSKELVQLGHEVDLVTMAFKDLPHRERINGVQVHRVPCIRSKESICHPIEMASYIVTAFVFMLKFLRQNKYHLNHTHFIFPDGVISYLVKKIFRIPYIVTAHGSDVPGYNPNRFKLFHKILFPLWRKVVENADQIIFPSSSLKSLFLKQSSNRKVSLIPNGIMINKFKADIRKEKRILVVTRMFERKGVQYFLRALEGLNSDYEIHIVGDGPYLQTLRDMARPLTSKVKFWGWLDNSSFEITHLYETSSIFVFTSEAENFPLVLLEAMASGMAIITTKGTGCAEVVGDAALLIEPRDSGAISSALTNLIHDDELRTRMGQAGHERLVNNFGWPNVASQYVNLYQRFQKAPEGG